MEKEMKMGLHWFVCNVTGLLGTVLNLVVLVGSSNMSSYYYDYYIMDYMNVYATKVVVSAVSAGMCLFAYINREKYTPEAYFFYKLFQVWQIAAAAIMALSVGYGMGVALMSTAIVSVIPVLMLFYYKKRKAVFQSGKYRYVNGFRAVLEESAEETGGDTVRRLICNGSAGFRLPSGSPLRKESGQEPTKSNPMPPV